MVYCVLIYCSCLVCFIVELLFIAVSLCCFCFLVLLFSFVFVFPDCVTVVVGFWFVVSLLLSMFYLFNVFLLLPVSMVSRVTVVVWLVVSFLVGLVCYCRHYCC